MSAPLTLHDLTPSPNNVKVRIALGYKGIAYERVPYEFGEFPGDRSPVFNISHQPRLPVLQHGETLIFDSGAIIRYLEANFPDTPPLFSNDYAAHGEIERWELAARTQISEGIGMMFGQVLSPEPDMQVVQQAVGLIQERTGALEEALANGDFLVGDHLTLADIACASPLYLSQLPEEFAQTNPLAAFFRQNLTLGEGRERTNAWIQRVVAYDPIMGRSPAVTA